MASEPIFEPLARWLRFNEMLPQLVAGSRLVDLGCGPNAPFWRRMGENFFGSYTGIDPLTKNKKLSPLAELRTGRIEETRLPAQSADFVIMSAVLEHVDDPLRVLKETRRILIPGGKVVLTTPSWSAKPVLEFLSFRLGLIARREIEEHQRYFTPGEVGDLLKRAGFRNVKTHYFEFGLNVFGCGEK